MLVNTSIKTFKNKIPGKIKEKMRKRKKTKKEVASYSLKETFQRKVVVQSGI